MADKLPFINSTGLVSKILDKIIEAQTPSRYTTDFQSTVLGYGSGSARPFIPLLKRIGFLQSDGSPTEIYKEFRADSNRGNAMARAIKMGYEPLYKVNEYAHELSKEKLKDAIIRVTGHDKKSSTVIAIVGTFEALKAYASFEVSGEGEVDSESPKQDLEGAVAMTPVSHGKSQEIKEDSPYPRGMNLSYTINLNLPASKDPEVFEAIFTSLKKNLLD